MFLEQRDKDINKDTYLFLNKYLLSNYYMSGTMLHLEQTVEDFLKPSQNVWPARQVLIPGSTI